METRVVTSHLPAELAEKLDGLAERLDRPRGWIVKEAMLLSSPCRKTGENLPPIAFAVFRLTTR